MSPSAIAMRSAGGPAEAAGNGERLGAVPSCPAELYRLKNRSEPGRSFHPPGDLLRRFREPGGPGVDNIMLGLSNNWVIVLPGRWPILTSNQTSIGRDKRPAKVPQSAGRVLPNFK